ncbi:hypothetical protein [Shewanella surugensis]|uniref:DUF3325 domain-containing protein n=1 Tax=Shewanella surugensis TaxID=212020 RepID=A0ABT0LFQ6_9GAMM|nr:hypothetical protein [Shewanella surugensis]MCL1126551.1 hypothetical protein [Shewanella surugensis]
MYWLILGFVIISAVIVLLPQNMSFEMADDPKLTSKKVTHYTLLLLPILVLAWLLVTLFNGSNTHFGATAISFVLSACAIALPKLHKLILPCAILTAICLLAESLF